MKFFCRRTLTFAGGLFALALVMSCAKRNLFWSEQVKTTQGSMEIVMRRVVAAGSGGTLESVELYHRRSGAYWKTNGNYQPVGFDFRNGAATLLLAIADPIGCKAARFPKTGLVVYQWSKEQGWKRLPDEELFSYPLFNLADDYMSVDGRRDYSGLVSWDRKTSVNDGAGIERWLTTYEKGCQQYERHAAGIQDESRGPDGLGMEGFHGKPTEFEGKG